MDSSWTVEFYTLSLNCTKDDVDSQTNFVLFFSFCLLQKEDNSLKEMSLLSFFVVPFS